MQSDLSDAVAVALVVTVVVIVGSSYRICSLHALAIGYRVSMLYYACTYTIYTPTSALRLLCCFVCYNDICSI